MVKYNFPKKLNELNLVVLNMSVVVAFSGTVFVTSLTSSCDNYSWLATVILKFKALGSV